MVKLEVMVMPKLSETTKNEANQESKRHNLTLKTDSSENEEDKEELIEVETMTINVSNRNVYGDVTRVYLMSI